MWMINKHIVKIILINIVFITTNLILIGCNFSSYKVKPIKDPIETSTNVHSESHMPNTNEKQIGLNMNDDCSSLDFIKLKEKDLQVSFWNNLDSIKKIQYPNNSQEVDIMFDLTPQYLDNFIANINKDILEKNNHFEKEYFFNIAPKGYSDSTICIDKISITFDAQSCRFKIKIFNTFLIDSESCTESVVTYGFKIKNGNIIEFWRNEAG